jgi:hypothetical protein
MLVPLRFSTGLVCCATLAAESTNFLRGNQPSGKQLSGDGPVSTAKPHVHSAVGWYFGSIGLCGLMHRTPFGFDLEWAVDGKTGHATRWFWQAVIS